MRWLKKCGVALLTAAAAGVASTATVATAAGGAAAPPDASVRASAGKAVTTRGEVDPAELGVTLMHEHLFVDWFPRFAPTDARRGVEGGLIRQMQESGWPVPFSAAQVQLFAAPTLTLDMIPAMRADARVRTNYVIDDEALVRDEVREFVARGGRTIVDQTPLGLGRDAARLARFARAAGINIVAGTGWYRWPFFPPAVRNRSVDDLAREMIRDLTTGIGTSGVRAGIIGEIGLDSRSVVIAEPTETRIADAIVAERSMAVRRRLLALPLAERERVPLDDVYHPFELKVLRAAGRASRATGAPISLHANDPWTGYLAVLEEEGVASGRVILSHAHAILEDRELLARTLRRGYIVQADYFLQLYATHAPLGNVPATLDGVAWAIDNGFIDQITLSLDICNKLGLRRYGGAGYATLHEFIFPELRARGITEEQIRHIMVDNPRRLLAWMQ